VSLSVGRSVGIGCPLSNLSSFHPIFPKFGQKFYLDDLKAKIKHWSCWVKN
jgi:hypothetical protein